MNEAGHDADESGAGVTGDTIPVLASRNCEENQNPQGR
jgi:hypothetical protein